MRLTESSANAGQAFIASAAINSFASDSRLGRLAYFYCNSGEESRRDPESILRALIHQLVQTESNKTTLLKPIVDAYESRRAKGQENSKLSLSESQALLVQLADVYQQITICIDALDEVEPSTQEVLLQALGFVMERSKNLVKIFVTTRMDVGTARQFEIFPKLELQPGGNDHDIPRFIKETIQTSAEGGQLLDGAVDDGLREEINALSKQSRGT